MKTIRNNVFETNSSSTHSLIIKRNMTKEYDYKVVMSKRGEVLLYYLQNINFGWGPAQYNDCNTKLNYLACLALECWQYTHSYEPEKLLKEPKEIYNLPDIKKLERVCKKNIPGFTKFVFNPEGFDNFNDTGELWINFDYNSIDHYSYENFSGIDDFLKHHKISIENFLFNPCVVLDIYNDNDYNGYDYTGR